MSYPYVLPVIATRNAGNGIVQVHYGQYWSEPTKDEKNK